VDRHGHCGQSAVIGPAACGLSAVRRKEKRYYASAGLDMLDAASGARRRLFCLILEYRLQCWRAVIPATRSSVNNLLAHGHCQPVTYVTQAMSLPRSDCQSDFQR